MARSESGDREYSQEKDKGRNVILVHGLLPVIMPQYALSYLKDCHGKDVILVW
jgi:predicted phosphodiesterase